MPVTTRNILAHELIGLQLTVADSSDPGLKGLTGLVRDETKNTLLLEAQGKLLTIPKAGATFLTKLPTGQSITITGDQLRYRPEDRVKKGVARW